jgi:ketosteroid isomerase-like protein
LRHISILAILTLFVITQLTPGTPTFAERASVNEMLKSVKEVNQSTSAAIAAAVKDVLKMQCEAWNHGDLDTFLTGYLKSDSISYIAKCQEVRGYEALHDRYAQRYGSSKETMGHLTMSNLDVRILGPEHAMCIGNWDVESSNKGTMGGIFTVILEKTKDGWKIIHDHTSVDESKTKSP